MKHRSSKGRLKEKEKRDSDIVDALQRYSKQVHPKGETLSDNVHISHKSGSGIPKSWYFTSKKSTASVNYWLSAYLAINTCVS